MKKQALEIVKATKAILDQFGSVDDNLLALLLEKDLEKILGAERVQGCWVRELSDGHINIGHAEAEVFCKKDCSNSVNIYLKPFARTGKPVPDAVKKFLDTQQQ